METTNFCVYPEHCNYLKGDTGKPMVHGGSLLLQMDRAAANAVRIALFDSDCDESRTVGVQDVTFFKGAELGDMIKIYSEIISLGLKRITCKVECMRVTKAGYEKMAAGTFAFCSFKDGKPHPHGLKELSDV